MKIRRAIEPELKSLAARYPVVTVEGPRQSGKTTLAKMAFPDKPYRTLEDPDELLAAQTDPRGYLADLKDGAVLDEVQRAPFLLSYIQGIVDERNTPGMYVLAGSQQFHLNANVSQSLAGRTAILRLLPLTIDEADAFGGPMDVDARLHRGFYPRTYDMDLEPTRMYASYFQTYVERDVRQLINLKDLTSFRNMLRLLAGRIGSNLNLAGLANDTGVAVATIRSWLSVLGASYIIFLLEPFFENFGKRIVRSPKLYFHDVGLATYLLGIETPSQARRDPLRGGLFENMVVCELLKHRFNRGLPPNLFYFRDNVGNEVDVVIRRGNALVPVEIKSSSTFNPEYLKGIVYFRRVAQDRCADGYVLYGGAEKRNVQGISILPYVRTGEMPLHE